MNDSSCSVVFEDQFIVRRALRGVSIEEANLREVYASINDTSAGLDDHFKWKKRRGMRNGNGLVPV